MARDCAMLPRNASATSVSLVLFMACPISMSVKSRGMVPEWRVLVPTAPPRDLDIIIVREVPSSSTTVR